MIFYDKKKNNITISLWKIKIKISLSIQRLIIKTLKPLWIFLDYIIPKDEKLIVFNSYPEYSDNAYAFFKYIQKYHSDKYKCFWVAVDLYKYEHLKNKCSDLYTFSTVWHTLRAKYIVSTHIMAFVSFFHLKKHIFLNLWHGMPLKTLGFNEKDIAPKCFDNYKYLGKHSYMFVTSDIFKLSMLACFNSLYDKTFITGQPRTDLIFDKSNTKKIENLFNFSKYNKTIFYMPTYKQSNATNKQIEQNYSNIFCFDDYEQKDFINLIQKENILFVIKPHPFEEDLYKNISNTLSLPSNIKILFNDDLQKENINLYELFNYIDLMISDFSSVVLDYLILNKPVIFLNNLTDDYCQNRGMILEDNYELLMPGHKAKTYKELKEKIMDSLTNDSTKELREQTLPLLHKYRDDKASERVFEIIKDLK